MVEYLEQHFTYMSKYMPWHLNIANPLSRNPLGGGNYVEVLSHDPFGI